MHQLGIPLRRRYAKAIAVLAERAVDLKTFFGTWALVWSMEGRYSRSAVCFLGSSFFDVYISSRCYFLLFENLTHLYFPFLQSNHSYMVHQIMKWGFEFFWNS